MFHGFLVYWCEMAIITKKNKFIYIRTKLPLPNGDRVYLQMIKHPGAVLIVPFLTNDKIVMIKQYRPVLGKYLYELPAGTLDKGEDLSICAKRELWEETGYKAKRITKLGKIYPVPGYATEVIYIYKAQNLMKEMPHCEADEVIHPFVINRRKIKALFAKGRIQDAKTICGLAFCGWL